MVRAVLLLMFAFGLFAGTVLSQGLREVLALAGIAGTCVAVNWLTTKERG